MGLVDPERDRGITWFITMMKTRVILEALLVPFVLQPSHLVKVGLEDRIYLTTITFMLLAANIFDSL